MRQIFFWSLVTSYAYQNVLINSVLQFVGGSTHVPTFFYPHIFTGSVGRRTLLVVPVDTLYRTSIISSSTVLPLNPFVNLSLAPLSLFSIYGPDLGCCPTVGSREFLRAPIPRKGSGSTTTTTHHSYSGTRKDIRPYFVEGKVEHRYELQAKVFSM